MNEKIVSQLDAAGYFVGTVIADESPLERGVFLIPAGAIDRLPPAIVEGKRYKPEARGGWLAEDVPTTEPPAAAELRRAEIVGRLSAIDSGSARPLRDVAAALAAGRPAPAFAVAKLGALETEAATLRTELAAL